MNASSPFVPKRILLVEDHLDTAKMMRVILEKHGFETQIASTVAQAMEATQTQHFDICICDMRLPDGDGSTLCANLRKERPLPCICLSGDVSISDLEPDPQSGFVACVAKPIDISKLLQAIDIALSSNS